MQIAVDAVPGAPLTGFVGEARALEAAGADAVLGRRRPAFNTPHPIGGHHAAAHDRELPEDGMRSA